ncbi:MAG: WD40-repeat-containing domain protein [Monoraphidium minutum]|nr:MAG: WD40-repeat-containing domain protein [Monoraphidium minutum]
MGSQTALRSAKAGVEEVSGATQAVLAIGGISVLVAALWLVSVLLRAVLSLLRAATGGAAAPKPQGSSKAAATKEDASSRAAPGRGSGGGGGGKRGPDLKTLIKESQKASKIALTKQDMAAHHALFLTTLKGHGDAINAVAWSVDGRLLASACDDCMVRVFDLADPANKDPKFRSVRTQYSPLGCGFGNGPNEVVAIIRDIPDQARMILYSPTKAKGAAMSFEPLWQTPMALDREPLLEAVVVPSAQAQTGGGVAVLLSPKKHGRVLRLSDGKPLAIFEPNSLGNHALAVSAGGRFFAVASFTADVKVWEVEWGRDGYKGVPRAMDLKGHSRKVMCAAISPDGTRAATASEDGTLRVWKLDVRYQLQEDPKTLLVAPLTDLGLRAGEVFERMAWGPDGTIAAAHGQFVHFFTGASARLLETLHAHEGRITCLAWAPGPLALGGGRRGAVLASSSADARVRVWRSPKELEQ